MVSRAPVRPSSSPDRPPPLPPPSLQAWTALSCSFLDPAARGRDLARRHQVPDVLLKEFVVVVEFVVFFLDRLNSVEESHQRVLQCFGVPWRSCQLAVRLSRARPTLCYARGIPRRLLGLTFAVPLSPLCRVIGYPHSSFAGSWLSRHLPPWAGQSAQRLSSRGAQSWYRCSCGSGALAARASGRGWGCRGTTPTTSPTSPGLLLCAVRRLPLWIRNVAGCGKVN